MCCQLESNLSNVSLTSHNCYIHQTQCLCLHTKPLTEFSVVFRKFKNTVYNWQKKRNTRRTERTNLLSVSKRTKQVNVRVSTGNVDWASTDERPVCDLLGESILPLCFSLFSLIDVSLSTWISRAEPTQSVVRRAHKPTLFTLFVEVASVHTYVLYPFSLVNDTDTPNEEQQQPLWAVAEPRRAAAASETASCNYYYRLPRYDEVQIAYRLPVIDYLCSCTALHANGDAISRDNWLCLFPPPFIPAGPPRRRHGVFLVNELEHFRVD